MNAWAVLLLLVASTFSPAHSFLPPTSLRIHSKTYCSYRSRSEEVPTSQIPLNELAELKQQPFFDLPERETFGRNLGGLYVATFLAVCWPIAGATWTDGGYLAQKLTAANVGTLFVVTAFLTRLYSGWSYVKARLDSPFVEYEETGWADGAVAKKPEADRIRDALVAKDAVEPTLSKLKTYLLASCSAWALSCGLLVMAVNSKPLFDEYDTGMLMQLNGDDKLAELAAKQANGKPAYCNSRYYRAVAGGGQGCGD